MRNVLASILLTVDSEEHAATESATIIRSDRIPPNAYVQKRDFSNIGRLYHSALVSSHLRESRCNPATHCGPTARALLAEQPHCRVPWTVVAVEQPAPFRELRQQKPDRPRERPRQMRHRSVDADHQIEPVDRGRRFGEIREPRRQIG